MNERIIMAILAIFCIAFLFFVEYDSATVKVYDCGMAEWHPDIPKEVRDECRKLRQEEYKKDQEEKSKKVLHI